MKIKEVTADGATVEFTAEEVEHLHFTRYTARELDYEEIEILGEFETIHDIIEKLQKAKRGEG
jgi:hypothetical protein